MIYIYIYTRVCFLKSQKGEGKREREKRMYFLHEIRRMTGYKNVILMVRA
jgi:hypothetical protein